MRRLPPKHLATRVVLTLTLLVVAIRAGFGLLETRWYEHLVVEEMLAGADELTRSITSATYHSMLADHRDDTYQIMRSISEEHGIARMRLFNKQGRVTFTTEEDAPEYVGVDDPACALCHSSREVLVRPDLNRRSRVSEGSPRTLQMVAAIYNAPECSNAACHAHEPQRQVLGILDLELDLSGVDAQLAALDRRSLWVTVVEVVLLGASIVFLTHRFVRRPLKALVAGTRAVGEMNLEDDVRAGSVKEFADLANSFNEMRRRLAAALKELRDLNETLEQQVEARTAQLQATQKQLIQSDRLASLGQLAASVAHEINNPVSGVLNFTMVIRRMLESDELTERQREDMKRYLRLMSEETTRVGRIVSDLLAFSRRPRPQSGEADLNELAQRVLTLLSHRLEMTGARVESQLDPHLPSLSGDASQLQQVLVNLVMNAAEAMPEGGRIAVATRLDEERQQAWLTVEDEGGGIDPELVDRIFDPFFSTKEEGKGVGLGLSVVYGIVEEHGGTIEVNSTPGVGTRFEVVLPLHRPAHLDRPGQEVGTTWPS